MTMSDDQCGLINQIMKLLQGWQDVSPERDTLDVLVAVGYTAGAILNALEGDMVAADNGRVHFVRAISVGLHGEEQPTILH